MLVKRSQTTEEKFSAFILPWYCSTAITPFPYAIAARKWATFPPMPSWLHLNQNQILIQDFSRPYLLELWLSNKRSFYGQILPYSNRSYTLLPKVFTICIKNFWNNLQSKRQVIFGQDSFPLNKTPFQASSLQNSANCFFANW